MSGHFCPSSPCPMCAPPRMAGIGIPVITDDRVPPGTMVFVRPPRLDFLRCETKIVTGEDGSDAYNVRFFFSLAQVPPPVYITGIDWGHEGYTWNTRPRRRKNPRRTTWGHQRA